MAAWTPSTFPPPATSVMPYFVYLTDAAQVASLQSTYPDGLSGLSPQAAGIAFGAPLYSPSLQSTTWIGTPLAGGVIPPATFWINNLFYAYDVTVASGSAPSTDPLYDFVPAPYYWVGYFRYWNTAPAVVQLGKRRWADGLELISLGGDASIDTVVSRDASRTVDGFGYSQRSRVSGETLSHTLSTYGTVTDPKYSWEIMYIRLRRLPSADVNFWRAYGFPRQSSGPALYVTSTGALRAQNIGSAATPIQDFGTSVDLQLNQWYRLDIRFMFNLANPVCPVPGTTTFGTFELLIDETASLTGLAPSTCAVQGDGLGSGFDVHLRSTIGNSFGDANTLEIDIDDWVNIAPTSYIRPPSGVPVTQFPLLTETCKDWEGHHMTLVRATARNALTNVNWIGDWRSLLQCPPIGGDSGTAVTTSTASAILAVDTDYLEQQSGCVAFTVAWYNRNISSGGAGYLLGYSILGGAAVLVAPTPAGAGTSPLAIWNSMLYSPTGLTAPTTIYPLVLVHKNTPTTDGRAITALGAEVEYLGAWGPEDTGVTAPGVSASTPTGTHNAPYVGTQWGSAVPLPLSAVVLQSGIYVGDSFGQDVLQAFPAHWWYVRNLSTPTTGTRWWSTMTAAHRGFQRASRASLMVQALIDTLNQVRMRIAGANLDNNLTGVNYQWIAFSDPGMRFLLNGAFAHNDALAATNNLVDADFLPEAAFFQEEFIGGSATDTCWFKGIGHLTDTASLLTAAQTSGVVTLGTGVLNVQSPLYTSSVTNQVAYSLWRRRDGNQITGNPLALATYTGDGTGTRVLTVDLSDRYPLFALVCPHNGQSWVRDPSHTGLNSSTANTSLMDTLHILGGGMNSITVGALLNANGIVYDVFVLPGCANGWFNTDCSGGGPPLPPGVIFPVPPDPGPGTQWTPAPDPPLDSATGAQIFGNGTDSGGGVGCANADLSNGTDSHGVVCE